MNYSIFYLRIYAFPYQNYFVEYSEIKKELSKLRDETDLEIEEIGKLNVKEIEYKGVKVIVRKNDITQEKVEAIVNPANEFLINEGGAAKSIADAGGDVINDECRKYISQYGKLPTGNAMITKAGNLPCKYVIHAVGPKYNKKLLDNSLAKAQLKLAIDNILKIVVDKDIKSVSMGTISTGIFGFPARKASQIIGGTVKSFIDCKTSRMKGKTIIFCNSDDPTIEEFRNYSLISFEENIQINNHSDFEDKNLNKSKNSEGSDNEEEKQEPKKCNQCDKGIKDKSHQKRGKYLNLCKDCYTENKKKKNKKKHEDEDDKPKKKKHQSEDSDSDDNKQKISNKKRNLTRANTEPDEVKTKKKHKHYKFDSSIESDEK